jgi:hypothetical protein
MKKPQRFGEGKWWSQGHTAGQQWSQDHTSSLNTNPDKPCGSALKPKCHRQKLLNVIQMSLEGSRESILTLKSQPWKMTCYEKHANLRFTRWEKKVWDKTDRARFQNISWVLHFTANNDLCTDRKVCVMQFTPHLLGGKKVVDILEIALAARFQMCRDLFLPCK